MPNSTQDRLYDLKRLQEISCLSVRTLRDHHIILIFWLSGAVKVHGIGHIPTQESGGKIIIDEKNQQTRGTCMTGAALGKLLPRQEIFHKKKNH
jgi:hypothetical protein